MLQVDHFNFKRVSQLLNIRKKIVISDKLMDEIDFNHEPPIKIQYKLVTIEEEYTVEFLYNINQGTKNMFKISLYLMYNDNMVGLVRLDFSGTHYNPHEVTEDIPEQFMKYVGKKFDYEPHIHYHLKGYKPLAWALPISEIGFEFDKIESHNDIIRTCLKFNEMISCVTIFKCNNNWLL